ncbi:hypothetical protein FrCorBMG51_06045 [Protofrankia coriariae]|uniref:Uncharacterized protein n=1 Tax=Protofrankia coriariae TaxID=1562887 RepID=A0ABR5F6A8_9ACTN|nr:hypothetical protein FrCorBMG51_06045 [Protofrankia coriariae]
MVRGSRAGDIRDQYRLRASEAFASEAFSAQSAASGVSARPGYVVMPVPGRFGPSRPGLMDTGGHDDRTTIMPIRPWPEPAGGCFRLPCVPVPIRPLAGTGLMLATRGRSAACPYVTGCPSGGDPVAYGQ